MTTTPPPMPEAIAWHEYARKKPSLKRLTFIRSGNQELLAKGWVSDALIDEAALTARDAQWMERVTALEADRKMLREVLTQTTRLLGELVAKDAQTYAPYMRVIDAASTALRNTHD